MSIVIHYRDGEINQDQIDELKQFYGCNNVEYYKYHLETPPENTLALLELGIDQAMPAHCTLNNDIRVIGINEAFAELTNSVTKMIDQHLETASTIETLVKQFLNERADIFTIDDVLEYLNMDKEKDGTMYALPSIFKLLEKHGCSKEVITVYTPPNGGKSAINYRFADPFEIAV